MEINNVDIKQTSFFTRLQMIDMGANPKSNWVDFSNLFMLLTGQPIHFFDADKVDGDIIIRNATDGEEFIDLFETNHTLKSTDIVIADKTKILALAGVVGGLNSGVSDTTKNILVEIANFDPVKVRKTGTRLSLRTDAELRYEKNINPWWSLYCLILFLDELKYYGKDLGNYELGGIAHYINPAITDSRYKTVSIDLDRIEKSIFGKQQNGFQNTAREILAGLGFGVNNDSVVCPIWRSPDDLNIMEDITEEIVRIYGYENVTNTPLLSDTNHIPYSPEIALQRKLEEILIETLHADQTETYPRVSEKLLNQFGKNTENMYSLINPVNPETPYLRDSLVYNLLGYVAKNSKFFDSFRIFDIGKVWEKSNTANPTGTYASQFINEQMMLGIFVYQKDISTWEQDPILEAKNIIKTIFNKLEVQTTINYIPTQNPSIHPKKQATISINGNDFGFVGSLHPMILKEHKIPETAGAVYISLSFNAILSLLAQQTDVKHHYETLQDQIVWRDLCFVIDNNQTFDAVLNSVKEIKDIKDLEVFDVYEGANLGEGKKSVSIKIKIVGDGNLTTEAINAIMDKAIKAAEKVGGKLR
ncbi:TPA: hypothetical protein DEP21_02665 [Patescibacteria group bacterium]|nr:hypothetical protein [Candidatus Gracilibacteria bacterium]